MQTICILVQNGYDGDVRVRRKAEALVAAGYEVDVIALRSLKKPEKFYVLNGVNVHTVPLGKQRGSLLRYFSEYFAFFFSAFWRLSKLMQTRRYGVVDVNNLPDFLVFATLWARLRGAKVIFDMHEITPEFYMSKYGRTMRSPGVVLNRILERASIAYAHQVITINEPIEDLLVGRGLKRERSTIIMNSVDLDFFAANDRMPSPANLPAKKAPFVMMYHGTLTRIYGLDIALEAFRQATADMPGAEFWILGRGPEEAALKTFAEQAGIADRVKLVGQIPAHEIPHWLNLCDIGVLATRRDVFLDLSFSNKLSEYIVKDKAVACSRLKAINRYFTDNALAYFEPNDPAALAQQMVRLYRDADARERLVAQARKEFLPIRWEVMRDRYLELVRSTYPGGVREPVEARVPTQV
jgi:glycosyltransferase involved in cell wall biosynthesis